MPRPPRVFVKGGIYHVYNRLARGERVFAELEEAEAFVALFREVATRDGLTVFGWCLMPNHYHLAVRVNDISLDRPMRSLQQRVTRRVNARQRVFGSLWQGRYKAKMVDTQRYLDQLLVYIHLNPITAGMVADPADYRWSGHSEILGRVRNPICGVDEVLRLFGTTRRKARAAYVRQLRADKEEAWLGEGPGHLPWWRLGRPPRGEDEDPEDAVRQRRAHEQEGPDWRPRVAAEALLEVLADNGSIDLEALRSRSRSANLVLGRELVTVVAVERYGVKVKDLAKELTKSPDGISQILRRGIRRRLGDEGFKAQVDTLDRVILDALGKE